MRFQSILADEFARRRGANPRYSLRAFAAYLGMEHSTLSQLLRGRRPITWKASRSITLKMRWAGTSVLSGASDGVKFDSRLIARNLNLTVDEVNVALTDLCMLGLIELKGETNECRTQ